MVTGNVTTDVIDSFTANGLGYPSAQEYWTANNIQFASYYVAEDSGYHFPRMGLCVRTQAEAVESGGIILQNFWLGDARFAFLFGSVSWLGGAETNAYSSNQAGYDTTESGLKYNYGATYPSTVYVDSDNVSLWGQDIGSSWFWYVTDSAEEASAYNDYAYFAPTYN